MGLAPDFLGFARENAADYGGRGAKKSGHDPREFVVREDIPFGEAAHDRRFQRINDASHAELADGEGAHRAGLDVRIDIAPPQAVFS